MTEVKEKKEFCLTIDNGVKTISFLFPTLDQAKHYHTYYRKYYRIRESIISEVEEPEDSEPESPKKMFLVLEIAENDYFYCNTNLDSFLKYLTTYFYFKSEMLSRPEGLIFYIINELGQIIVKLNFRSVITQYPKDNENILFDSKLLETIMIRHQYEPSKKPHVIFKNKRMYVQELNYDEEKWEKAREKDNELHSDPKFLKEMYGFMEKETTKKQKT